MLTRIRTFCRDHAIVFAILISLVTLGISSLFQWDANAIMGVDKLIGDCLITLVCMGLIRFLGLWPTAGFRRAGYRKGLVYGSLFIVIGFAAAAVGNIGVDWAALRFLGAGHALLFTLNMLLVGLNEETSMRALILNNLVRRFGSDVRGMRRAVVVSSLVFGAIHLVNLFFMPPVTVVVQTINAAAAGVLFAAVYLGSGNLWAGVTVHAVVDWLSLFIGQCFAGGASVLSADLGVAQGLVLVIAGALPPVVIALFILKRRPAAQQQL